MKITPTGNRVLAEKRTISDIAGIHLPTGAAGAFTLHVLDVGEGLRLDNGTIVPVPFKAGDEIMTYQGGVMALPPELFGGKEYVLIEVPAITCKVERDTPMDGMGGAIVRPAKAGNGRLVN